LPCVLRDVERTFLVSRRWTPHRPPTVLVPLHHHVTWKTKTMSFLPLFCVSLLFLLFSLHSSLPRLSTKATRDLPTWCVVRWPTPSQMALVCAVRRSISTKVNRNSPTIIHFRPLITCVTRDEQPSIPPNNQTRENLIRICRNLRVIRVLICCGQC
jgi:hypothetical protein